MALVKLGSVKKTDLVISGSVNLSTDVGSSILPVANGGTGNGSFVNGQLLIGNTTGNTLTKATLTGTANQVTVTNGAGSITLSLPQDIATSSSPTFANMTITTGGQLLLPNNGLHLSDSSESGKYLHVNCADATLTVDRSLSINVGNANRGLAIAGDSKLDQDVSSTGSPTFSSLTLGSPLAAANGGTGLSSLGTGVSSALSVNIGTGGSFITNGGALGTPTSGTLTNCTGLPISTGVSGLGTGVAAFLATPSSANLASAVTDETGSGKVVFGTSPTMTNVTINQAANGDTAITSVRNTDTSPTGSFIDFRSAASASVFKVDRFGALTVNVTAQSSTAERLLTFGVSDSASTFTLDNGTSNANFFNPTFNGTIAPTAEGVPISFFGTKGVDNATNPAILFLGRHNTGGGNTDLSATVPLSEWRNRATSLMFVYGNGDLKLVKSGATLGYGTGTGGTVTQATNRTTGVTLSTSTGAITTNNTSLAAGASATFTVTNTVVTAIDVVVLAIKSGQTNKETSVAVTAVAAGSFDITVHNKNATTAETGSIIINFVVIKGATS